MKAGFAEVDITPEKGLKKAGWMMDISGDEILDPLFARAAVFEDGQNSIGFIQLDLLSVRWTTVNEIREKIAKRCEEFDTKNVMVSATHNHAGTAIAKLAPVDAEEEYLVEIIEKCVTCFCAAFEKREEAMLGCNSALEFDVAFNRRVRTRDGLVKTQLSSKDEMFLCIEGPVDPEIAVVALKNKSGKPLGMLINFACHPIHHGSDNCITAGFPGVVCRKVKEAGLGIPLYLNGAYGNVIHNDFCHGNHLTMDEAGGKVFGKVAAVYEEIEYQEDMAVKSLSETIEADYREIDEAHYKGKNLGAQRFRDDELYEAAIDKVIEKKKLGKQKIEIQTHRIGDIFFSAMPAEYFVEFQIELKTTVYPDRAFIVGGANGMIGYVPTEGAYQRGGYETTLGPPSKMSPGTGEMMLKTAIGQIKTM